MPAGPFGPTLPDGPLAAGRTQCFGWERRLLAGTTMLRKDRYRIAKSTQRVCGLLKIAPERVLRRAGLPPDYVVHEGRGADAAQCFAVWNAIVAEARRPDLALVLGKAAAQGPFNPAVFAFTCSPTIAVGLSRLAVFKPLVGPLSLAVERGPDGLRLTLTSADAATPLPSSLAALEMVHFLELARIYSAEPIVPLSVTLPGDPENRAGLDAHFGVAAAVAGQATMVLSLADADRPLVSENEEMWAGFEAEFRRQLRERDREAPMSARVQSALLDMLPSGQSSAEAVCRRLHVSKRSLHRHLKSEGHSFQGLLDDTRAELSLHYLSKGDVSVEEISYLLAFRDPNSFYRAFRGWTGMTPMEARAQRAP